MVGAVRVLTAPHYGVEADGITLSPQQAKLARERIKEAGLEISTTLRAAEAGGFEVRDVESLREHYVYTLRYWLRRLDEHALAVVYGCVCSWIRDCS